MHLVHLTIAPDAIVSSLLDWTDSEQYVSGSSRERRLSELWEHYHSWCNDNGIKDRAQRKLFTVQTLSPDSVGYVEVSQKRLNATAARYMLFWLSAVAKDYAVTHGAEADEWLSSLTIRNNFLYIGPQHLICIWHQKKQFQVFQRFCGSWPRYRAGVACGLAEMELVCLENTRRLTLSEWQRLEEGYLCYRAAANHLCRLAITNGIPRWHVRPKCHYLEHAVYDFGMKNLRHMSNYLDEDMIRRVKRMAVAAHPFVSQHVMYRYALAACLRWTGMIR